MQVRIREVLGTMRVVDGDSLLSAPVLERVVMSVLEALEKGQRDDARRRRDTRIGDDGGNSGGEEWSA